MSSPLLGVGGLRRAEKGANEIFVTMGVNGEFLHFGGFCDAKCGPIRTAQTCAHSGVEPSRSATAFLQGGPKSSKKFRIFHHLETLRPYITETVTNRVSK